MSHQTKQESIVTVTSLALLARAVQCVQIENLGTHLVFDQSRTQARYYGTNIDNNADNVGVIGYARELTSSEQMSNYEIAVRKGRKEIDGHMMDVYDLYGDVSASDRTMRDKIAKIFEEHQIAVVQDQAANIGAMSCEEVFDDTDAPEGYRVMEMTVNV